MSSSRAAALSLLQPTPSHVTPVDELVEEPIATTTPHSATAEDKKRRRTRSRSRRSKDLKNKLKVATPLIAPNCSSRERTLPGRRSRSYKTSTPKPLRSDPTAPQYTEAGFRPPKSLSTPMLPSLKVVRSGLFRSNSASRPVLARRSRHRLPLPRNGSAGEKGGALLAHLPSPMVGNLHQPYRPHRCYRIFPPHASC
jgi:hypothetical protein